MSDVTVIDGWNCNRVEYGDGQERKGTLQQVARDRWSEDSVIAGEVHFEYTELRRDEWSVYLHDAERDMYVELDLHTREVRYGVGAAPTLPMYVVIESSQRPHGRMVNRVDMGQGGAPNGSLRQVGASHWQEVDVKGAVTFEYDEVGRDDWSVNLHDAGRNVRLRIDHPRSSPRRAVRRPRIDRWTGPPGWRSTTRAPSAPSPSSVGATTGRCTSRAATARSVSSICSRVTSPAAWIRSGRSRRCDAGRHQRQATSFLSLRPVASIADCSR